MKHLNLSKLLFFNVVIIMSITAQGNLEQDSLALVAIQEANPDSRLDWDYSKPLLGNWSGVYVINGRVEWLFLNNLDLTCIPKEIEYLTNLKLLYLGTNNISSIPVEIGKLKKLKKSI